MSLDTECGASVQPTNGVSASSDQNRVLSGRLCAELRVQGNKMDDCHVAAPHGGQHGPFL